LVIGHRALGNLINEKTFGGSDADGGSNEIRKTESFKVVKKQVFTRHKKRTLSGSFFIH